MKLIQLSKSLQYEDEQEMHIEIKEGDIYLFIELDERKYERKYWAIEQIVPTTKTGSIVYKYINSITIDRDWTKGDLPEEYYIQVARSMKAFKLTKDELALILIKPDYDFIIQLIEGTH